MIKLNQLSSILFAKKIETPEQLNELLLRRHDSLPFLGMKFMPKYELDQDVLELSGAKELNIPNGLNLTFSGKGDSSVKLKLEGGSVFKAPLASFGDMVTSARRAVVMSVNNLISLSGNSTVSVVKGNNVSKHSAVQDIQMVKGDNLALGRSKQKIWHIFGNNESYGTSTQKIQMVDLNTSSHHRSVQNLDFLGGKFNIYDQSKINIPVDAY